jgi:stress-induced-phosphoprotein 1
MAAEQKEFGNAEFKAGNYEKAISFFTKSIELGGDHVLYSNRSACYAGLGKWDEALKDAESCIEKSPTWAKGFGRKGAALHGQGRFDKAIAAYEEGLKIEPNLAMLTNGLADAKREAERQEAGGMGQLGNVFGAPDVLQKIASNPQTAPLLADPSFMQKLEELKRDPNSISKHLGDQRILSVMGMLMGVNIQTADSMGSDGGSSAAPPHAKKKAPEPEPETVPLTPEEEARKAKKAEADVHKDAGNVVYRAKSFEEAIGHYEKAIAVLPDEITYYNNMAAVRFEQKDYDKCIETCKKGVEVGRAVKADFKIVAKSYARIANAYMKQGMFDEAIRAFEDSLMEDRTPNVEKDMKAAQKAKKLAAEKAYLSPELAEKARAEGNELFKAGNYPAAIEKYTDAMKRDPTSALPYSNRAGCYQKLMEWQLALKDAETCVAMDPKFLKGWSRKGGIHLFLKEFHKALDCYQAILDLHPENADAKANMEHVMMKINEANQSGEADPERQKRAMADPEIQQILGDPQMRSILQEMQTDPKKANSAMQDPDISAKLQKLIAAGVLQVR